LRTLRLSVFGLLALVSLPQFLFAQRDKPVIAVFPLSEVTLGNAKGSGDLSSALMDMVTTELSKKPNIVVVDRAQQQDILMKQKLLVSGRVADEEMQRAAKILGADYIVAGQATFIGSEVRMDLRLSNAETGEISNTFKQRDKQDNLLTIVEQLADAFTKDLKPVARRMLVEVDVPASAVLTYSRGLDLEKRGNRAKAAQMFEKVLQISPSYEDAQKALARVK
jgi:TolB-like protein